MKKFTKYIRVYFYQILLLLFLTSCFSTKVININNGESLNDNDKITDVVLKTGNKIEFYNNQCRYSKSRAVIVGYPKEIDIDTVINNNLVKSKFDKLPEYYSELRIIPVQEIQTVSIRNFAWDWTILSLLSIIGVSLLLF